MFDTLPRVVVACPLAPREIRRHRRCLGGMLTVAGLPQVDLRMACGLLKAARPGL